MGVRRVVHASFASAVPADAPLVVRAKRSARVVHVVLLVCVVAQVLVVAALVGLGVWSRYPVVAVPVLLGLFQLWLMVLVVREYRGLLGPQLAADNTGVWVRTGLGSRPEVVYLPWQAIDGVDTTRKALRITSREGEALFRGRMHWRVRTVRRRFGTPFVVGGRMLAVRPNDLLARLTTVPR